MSISKMKRFDAGTKYTKLDSKSSHGKVPSDYHNVSPKAKPKRQKQSTDSSDSDDVIISTNEPPRRKRAKKAPSRRSHKSKRVSKTHPDKTVEKPTTVTNVTEDSDHISVNNTEEENISDEDTSGMSNDDAQEALEDANTSRKQDDSITSSPSREFGDIDNQNIVLSDMN